MTSPPRPEEQIEDKYNNFDAPNCLLRDGCVVLVRGKFIRQVAPNPEYDASKASEPSYTVRESVVGSLEESYSGPIDIRQNLPPEATFDGQLALGDFCHPGLGHLLPESVVITISYPWSPVPLFLPKADTDHPDPKKYYLRLVQNCLGTMFQCMEYGGDVK